MITTFILYKEACIMIRTKIMDTSSGGCAMSAGLYNHYIICTKKVKCFMHNAENNFCANCTKRG